MMYLLLIVGFVLLIKGADMFVDGSSSIAALLKVPGVVIGLTIVALGTSAPEAAVSITAGLTGNNDISISNIVGSNMFNLLMVVGVCAAIKAFQSDLDILKRDFPICIGLTAILILFAMNGTISRIEGVILVVLMIIYIIMMVRSAMKNRIEADEQIKVMTPLKSVIFCLIGLGAIVLGGDLVVDSASDIATTFGMSQTLIGLTIIAIGTSLPELVTSIVAAGKGQSGMALGNVVGSSIFNIVFILGASSTLHAIKVNSQVMTDIVILLGICLIVFLFCQTKKLVSRGEGIACVLLYCAYTAFIIMR